MKIGFVLKEKLKQNDLVLKCVKELRILELTPFSLNPLSALDLLLKSQLSYVFLDEQVETTNGMAIIRHLDKPIQIFICQITKDVIAPLQKEMANLKMATVPIDQFGTTINNTLDVFKTSNYRQKEKEQTKDYLFVQTEVKGKMIKLEFSDINFIQAKNNTVIFHTKDKTIVSRISLSQLENTLPKDSFMRVHKSYIIPIKKVVGVDRHGLKLSFQESPIPLSPNYRDAFLKKIN
jgi:two-component system, LytTR family, response regulator